MIDWLKYKQGAIGVQMEQCVTRALAQVVKDPLKVMPPGHKLSTREILDIKRNGAGRITEKVYRLVFKELNNKASRLDLHFEIRTSQQLAQIYENVAEKKRPVRSVNTAVKSDAKASGNSSGGGSGATDKCPTCNMFCQAKTSECNYWDKNTRKFKVQGFIDNPRNRWVAQDGRQFLGNKSFKRLQQFGFPKMGITKEADVTQIENQLRQAVEKFPIVPEKDRWVSKGAVKQVNFAESSANTGVEQLQQLRTEVANLARTVSETKKTVRSRSFGKPKKSKPKGGDYISDSDDTGPYGDDALGYEILDDDDDDLN